MTVNTTAGPRRVDTTPHGVVNTSRVVEEDLIYTDSDPEVIGTAAGDGWHCVYELQERLRAIPVLCWSQLDNDEMHPVIAPRGGPKVDLTVDVSNDSRFRGYIRPPAGVDVALLTGADIKELLTLQTITIEEDE